MSTDIQAFQTGNGIDVAGLVDWLATSPPPAEVTATREQALSFADYLRNRDRPKLVEARQAARVVEWNMAHRWPAGPVGAYRTDDRPELLADNSADRVAWQRVYAVGSQDLDWIRSRTEPEELTQAAIIRGPQQGPPPISTGGAIEWYTPPQYIEAARRVMGSIDLDPATSEVAQATVQAGTYYTKETNGLDKPWLGNVWCNPPYSSELINAFTARIVEHGEQWLVLTNNGTDTRWGQALLRACTAVCFTDHRIRFHNEDGEPQGPAMQGQMFTYYGPNTEQFTAEFGAFGLVMYP